MHVVPNIEKFRELNLGGGANANGAPHVHISGVQSITPHKIRMLYKWNKKIQAVYVKRDASIVQHFRFLILLLENLSNVCRWELFFVGNNCSTLWQNYEVLYF